jgi:hypothetical protein
VLIRLLHLLVASAAGAPESACGGPYGDPLAGRGRSPSRRIASVRCGSAPWLARWRRASRTPDRTAMRSAVSMSLRTAPLSWARARRWPISRRRPAAAAATVVCTSTPALAMASMRSASGHQVMDAFWCHPVQAEAVACRTYPCDSDPAGTPYAPLARPFAAETRPTRGDRAWLAGSLALSTLETQATYLRHASAHELVGAPETDLHISD